MATVNARIEVKVHIPSPFYNRGEQDQSFYNYGRLEADILHHTTAAVYAMASAAGSPALAREHTKHARMLLDKLDELIDMFPKVDGNT